MGSNQALALPSTSRESFHTCLDEQETDKDNTVAMRCLEVIEKIASKLKSDTSGFVDILQKILAVVEDRTVDRDSKYDLIDKVMLNIMDADKEELISIKDDFKKIFCRREVRKLLVDDSAILRMGHLAIGEFGIFTRGILEGPGETAKEVAIKSAKEYQYKEMIENEASILSQLNHKNIIKLLAITRSESEIVLELMDFGNLASAVEEINFSPLNLLKILHDVASGMEYLHGKKFIHRDLTCCNIFLNSKKKCKIGNFEHCVYMGDSEGVYEDKVDKQRYNLSPETLLSKEFTMQNDVWAMGILCWQLFYIVEHANEIPPAMVTIKIHLQHYPHFMERFIKPRPCPQNLYAYILEQLLERNPKLRPTFTTIKEKLKEFISSS